MALLSVSSLSLPLDTPFSKQAFWYASGVLFIWSFHVEKNVPPLPTSHIVTSLISHHSDTFNNLSFNSNEGTVMTSEKAWWRVKKNGNCNNHGRSGSQMGKIKPSDQWMLQAINPTEIYWALLCVQHWDMSLNNTVLFAYCCLCSNMWYVSSQQHCKSLWTGTMKPGKRVYFRLN